MTSDHTVNKPRWDTKRFCNLTHSDVSLVVKVHRTARIFKLQVLGEGHGGGLSGRLGQEAHWVTVVTTLIGWTSQIGDSFNPDVRRNEPVQYANVCPVGGIRHESEQPIAPASITDPPAGVGLPATTAQVALVQQTSGYPSSQLRK